jgi:serine/threonine protein kinase
VENAPNEEPAKLGDWDGWGTPEMILDLTGKTDALEIEDLDSENITHPQDENSGPENNTHPQDDVSAWEDEDDPALITPYHAMEDVYGTSMPKVSFMTQASLRSPSRALVRGQFSLGSPRSYATAQSSPASYATASSVLSRRWDKPRIVHDASNFQSTYETRRLAAAGQVFSSKWLEYLHNRKILLDQRDELNWSGRGQHVEYEPSEENTIPLVRQEILGYSASAIVESVKCRRIRLARKTIRCHRRFKKEDAVVEVEHLQHLQHSHIIRVVGTYTLKDTLAILLYPATRWNLDEFMDVLLAPDSPVNTAWYWHDKTGSLGWQPQAGHRILSTFFGCLSGAILFIHNQNIKHMDIKPKNLLVRLPSNHLSDYKIYIADFEIARAYISAHDTYTDSPISFTRTYAAPEVVMQERKGFSADVFSLGCVFTEMLAIMISTPEHDERQRLLDLRIATSGGGTFYSSIDTVLLWHHDTHRIAYEKGLSSRWLSKIFIDKVAQMIQAVPELRPTMISVKNATPPGMYCGRCEEGPEPFEAADEVPS